MKKKTFINVKEDSISAIVFVFDILQSNSFYQSSMILRLQTLVQKSMKFILITS